MKPLTIERLAAVALLAASAGMPPLGQQTRIANRPNVAGERLRPAPPPKRRQVDQARIAAAQAKRERRQQRNLRNASAFLLVG